MAVRIMIVIDATGEWHIVGEPIVAKDGKFVVQFLAGLTLVHPIEFQWVEGVFPIPQGDLNDQNRDS